MAFASKKPLSMKSDKKVSVPDSRNTSRQSASKYFQSKRLTAGKTSERTSKQPPLPRVPHKKVNINQSSKEPLKDVVKTTKRTINTKEEKPVINTRAALKSYSGYLKENNEQDIISNIETKNDPNFSYHPKQSKNIVLHSCSEKYIPKNFSVQVQVKQEPIVKNKIAIEEIQKNLNSWRIQRKTKILEHSTKKIPCSDSNTYSIYKRTDKFSYGKTINVDVENLNRNDNSKSNQVNFIDESTNSIEMNCVNLSTGNMKQNDIYSDTSKKSIAQGKNTMHNISVQVDHNEELNFKFTDTTLEFKANSLTENFVKNINNSVTYDGTVVLRRHKCNMSNAENIKEVKCNEINSNKHHCKQQETLINNSCSDKHDQEENDVNKSNPDVNSGTMTAHKEHSESLPGESFVEKHKEYILALVDNYFNKTKCNKNLSIDNFMKYLLLYVRSNKSLQTNSRDIEEQLNKTFNIEQIFKSPEEPQPTKESDLEKVSQKENSMESSVTSTVKRKEKYSKKLNTRIFRYKNPPVYCNPPLPTILSKKEKFKTLSLVNSHQYDKMCIHINYQPQSSPIDKKSKLSVYKESPINIRPHLTKHTFATATCKPQQYSIKPNISLTCLQHLDEGGCKEIKFNNEVTPGKNIYPNLETSSDKQTRIDLLIKELIRYTKLRMHLTNKMTSAVVEKLLTLQESMCNFYSNSFDIKNLSPESRELLRIIMMEIDNPERLDLDVKTNQNLKCILQRLVDSVQFESRRNASGDPPNLQSNYSVPVCHSLYKDNSKKSCHTSRPSSKRSRILKSSFGMRKNYISKRIRPSLDKELNSSEKKPNNCDHSVLAGSTHIKPISPCTLEEKSVCTDLPEDKNDIKDFSSEGGSSVQGFSLSDKKHNTDSTTISLELPGKCVNGMKPADLSGINIRLRDRKTGCGTEHYRISVKTEEKSIIQGVQPELPCTLFNEEIYSRLSRDKNVLNVKKSSISDLCKPSATDLQEVTSAHKKTIALNSEGVFDDMCEKLNDILKNPKNTMKSRNNFTKSNRSFDRCEPLCLSGPDLSINPSKNQFGCQGHKNRLLTEQNCGDSNIIILNMSNSLNQNKLKNNVQEKMNVGVNTDVSLLENLLKSLHQSTSEDSYACDLSLCCSTTANELSEGEIGFYAHESNYPTSQPSSERKFYCHPCQSMRNIRMFNIQQTADIFLI